MNEKNVQTIRKTVKQYGNSGGVYVPSSWIGGEVDVSLVRSPAVPARDIPIAFSDKMKHIISAFVYGSFARGDHDADSDIDVIVVADGQEKAFPVPDTLRKKNYDIRIFDKDQARNLAKKDVLFKKSLEDAKAILNQCFLDELKSIKADKGNIKNRIDFARSSLNIMKNIRAEADDRPETVLPLIYPIIMRIKEMVLIQCIKTGRGFSLGLLENTLRKNGITGNDVIRLIKHYRAVRDGRKPPQYAFKRDVLDTLIGMLEGLIKDVSKKKQG